MDRQEVLLKEYEVCQQDSSSMSSTHWTVVGIFMGINTALLGGVAYAVIAQSVPLCGNIKWLVLILSLVVIAIVIFLKFWLDRVNFLIYINNYRMRQIESHLGMQKNHMVNFLDHHWDELTDEQKKRFRDLRKRYTPPLRRFKGVNFLYLIITVT